MTEREGAGTEYFTTDICALVTHEPYQEEGQPGPYNATIVSARTFLHPLVPQPTGRLLYQAFTAPGRAPGQLVPLSTVTAEVGGLLADYAPAWEEATHVIVQMARDRMCDAMPLGLPDVDIALLSGGPATTHRVYDLSTGTTTPRGPADRQALIAKLQEHVDRYVDEGPFWPGYRLAPH